MSSPTSHPLERQLIPDDALGIAPEEVVRLNAKAQQAIDALIAATAARRAAVAARDAAPRADAVALADAARSGKTAPPATEAAAEREAQRAHAAEAMVRASATDALREMRAAVVTAVADGRWVREQRDETENRLEHVHNLIDEVDHEFDRLADATAVSDALARFLNSGPHGPELVRAREFSGRTRNPGFLEAGSVKPNRSALLAAIRSVASSFLPSVPRSLDPELAEQDRRFREQHEAMKKMVGQFK